MAPDPAVPSAILAGWRAIEQAAEKGEWHDDVFTDTARTAFPLIVAAVEAALELTRDGDGDDLYPSVELTVGDVREAIRAALTGEETSDGR